MVRSFEMPGDDRLVQIVDAALVETARLSGPWLLCRPGCAQCCLGEFPITQLDAQRLRRGLADLRAHEPLRADWVRRRAREMAAREMTDDDPCPALDPETSTCDLYAARPIVCREFGPPVRTDEGDLGVCELCFSGATEAEIAACNVEYPDELERRLISELEESTGLRGATTVARALSG